MSRRRSRTGGRTLVEFRFMIHAVQVEHLLSISADLKRRNDKEIVNRAAVVFLMAVWQTHAEAVAQDAVEKMAGQAGSPVRLSTPNSRKVDDLFEKAIGLKNVSQYWRWRGMTAARARTRLNKILELRHEIAHKGRAKARFQTAVLLSHVHFVHRLAVCLYNAAASHIAQQTGQKIRARMRYRRVIGALS